MKKFIIIGIILVIIVAIIIFIRKKMKSSSDEEVKQTVINGNPVSYNPKTNEGSMTLPSGQVITGNLETFNAPTPQVGKPRAGQ